MASQLEIDDRESFMRSSSSFDDAKSRRWLKIVRRKDEVEERELKILDRLMEVGQERRIGAFNICHEDV